MKDKVLVVVPTIGLQLVKEVLDKLYSNSNLNIKTIIVKNGTYSNDEYESFDFELPNVIKTYSEKIVTHFSLDECRYGLHYR